MTPAESQQYLASFINYEIRLDRAGRADFKIERARKLLDLLGNPQKKFKIIHVAGSKGKGSVCALIANILKKAGYRVGLYTSPHLDNYRERIRVLAEPSDGAGSGPDIFPNMISEDELCATLETVKPAVEALRRDGSPGPASFFEVFTALALCYFAQRNIDFAVLETGMGGRLDATNAADSDIAVLTPVSLEHTRLLGNDVAQIAREKAAIIKSPRQKVVIAPQEKKVRSVLAKRCAKFAIDPFWTDDYVQVTPVSRSAAGQVLDLATPRRGFGGIALPVLGPHQRNNCAVAAGIVESLQDLGYNIPIESFRQGAEDLFWPGRFEIVHQEPVVILDGAHNKTSADMLKRSVEEIYPGEKIILVLGVSKDKNVKDICSAFTDISKYTLFVKADHPRSGDLSGALNIPKAVDLILNKCNKNDIVLVTGSLYVVAEARRIIKKLCTSSRV